MITVKQLLEQYDLVTGKDDADSRRLKTLSEQGLLDVKKIPVLKRALRENTKDMTMAEKKSLLEMVDSLLSVVDSENLQEAKKPNYLSKFDDRRPATYPPEKDMPSIIILQRKAIRVFPDNQKIGLYYSQALDRYVSIPFGDSNHFGAQINEATMPPVPPTGFGRGVDPRKKMVKKLRRKPKPEEEDQIAYDSFVKNATPRELAAISKTPGKDLLRVAGQTAASGVPLHITGAALLGAYIGTKRQQGKILPKAQSVGLAESFKRKLADKRQQLPEAVAAPVAVPLLAGAAPTLAATATALAPVAIAAGIVGAGVYGYKKYKEYKKNSKAKDAPPPVVTPQNKKTTEVQTPPSVAKAPEGDKKFEVKAPTAPNIPFKAPAPTAPPITVPVPGTVSAKPIEVPETKPPKPVAVPETKPAAPVAVPETKPATKPEAVPGAQTGTQTGTQAKTDAKTDAKTRTREPRRPPRRPRIREIPFSDPSDLTKPSPAKYNFGLEPNITGTGRVTVDPSAAGAQTRAWKGNVLGTSAQPQQFDRYFGESNFEIVRSVANDPNASKQVMFAENAVTINNRIAKKIMNVYESLSTENKNKIKQMINEDVVSFRKVVNFAVRQ